MKFGPVAVENAQGAVLAHATTAGEKRFRKAHVLTAEDIAVLKAAGIGEVVAAMLSPDDLGEDLAATRLAESMRFRGIEAKPAATGRVNLHATASGVFTVDKAMIDRVNAIDPAITVATVAEYEAVEKGQMVATVKIIPFGVAGRLVDAAASILAEAEIFAVNPFRPMRVGVIQTVLPSVKDSVLAKTIRVTEARLARSGSMVGRNCGHRMHRRRSPLRLLPLPRKATWLSSSVRRHFAISRMSFHPPSGRQAARFFAPACRSIPGTCWCSENSAIYR